MIDQFENNVKESTKEVRTKTLTYISTALGLVAGLAWNDAIKALIEILFPISKNTIFAQFLYAILITAVVVILIGQLSKIFKDPQN